MIKEKYISIKITTGNKANFYRDKGYSCNKGDVIDVKIEDVGKYDKTFNITLVCDSCGKEKSINNANCWNYHCNGDYLCNTCKKGVLDKRKCEICGSTHNVSNYLNNGIFLCDRHKAQIRDHGCIKRTATDGNEIRIFEDYAEFDTYDNKTGKVNGTFKIDLDMIDFIKAHKCHKHYSGYACCHIKDKNGIDKKIRLHRAVLGLENDKRKDIVVDHINRDKSDDRKCNLRIVSHEANNRNTDMYSHNTSGVKGISWDKRREKWEIYIHQHNKKINLGLYKDKNKAIQVREMAEIIYFGKDSPRYEELINKYMNEEEVKQYLLNK